MAKVAGTFGHVAGARLTAGLSVDDTLTGVHEASELRAARFHGLWEADAAFCDRHAALETFHVIMQRTQKASRKIYKKKKRVNSFLIHILGTETVEKTLKHERNAMQRFCLE